jgi:hypothetical protein
MKVEFRVILGASFFLAVVAVIYVLWGPAIETASGTAMLIFSFAAYGMLGSFLVLQWLRRHRLPRPEDRTDAEQSDGEGAVAFFPSNSIWPAGLGLGAVITSMAFIFGNWYWFIGLPLVFGSVIGFVVEAEHGYDIEEDVPEEFRQHDPIGRAREDDVADTPSPHSPH